MDVRRKVTRLSVCVPPIFGEGLDTVTFAHVSFEKKKKRERRAHADNRSEYCTEASQSDFEILRDDPSDWHGLSHRKISPPPTHAYLVWILRLHLGSDRRGKI